jgi:hypothetical protein
LAARLAPILAAAALNMACSDDDPVAGDDADGVPPPVSADASVDHSTPRIVPHVKPSAVAAVRYPQLPADEIAVLPLQTVGRLAGECRDLVRSGCLPIYGRGVELTRGKPTLKAEHVQYLFDSANELARQTLWEDGELTEDRFAAEDSNVAGPEAANTLAGVTRAERIYLQIIERFPGTPWQAQAALERARLYCNGLSARWDRVHRDRARRLFAEVVRDFPKTPQAAQAAQELQKLGRQKRR